MINKARLLLSTRSGALNLQLALTLTTWKIAVKSVLKWSKHVFASIT